VSVNRSDISQIRKYLNGELDARAMYELELRAQNDPFLMDAMTGIETAKGNHQPQLDAIGRLIKKRVEQDKKRVVPMYRYWAAAASILLLLGIDGWWLTRQSSETEIEKNMAKQMPADKTRVTPSIVKTPAPELPKVNRILSQQPIAKVKRSSVTDPALKPVTDSIADKLAANKKPEDDIVVRGYVTRSRQQATGSSYIITGKEVQDNPVGNVEQLLQGKVAGLNIQNNKEEADVNGQHIITGAVTDALTGEPLAGATISADGKGLTQADINGRFRVTVPGNIKELMVTFVSYGPQRIWLDKNRDFKIQLNQSTLALNETVVRGYVKRNRDQTTGSSYIITGKEVQDHDKKTTPQDFRYGGKVPGKFLSLLNPKRILKPGECNENLKFKEKFFDNMATAEKYTLAHISGGETTVSEKKMLKALKFISGYTTVSINTDDKDKVKYPDIDTFIADKIEWLKWYEANKCKGLR
jgi:hypothetical protein